MLDCSDKSLRPIDDELLKAIALVHEGEHVLLHGLSGLLFRDTLLVVLVLRCE